MWETFTLDSQFHLNLLLMNIFNDVARVAHISRYELFPQTSGYKYTKAERLMSGVFPQTL